MIVVDASALLEVLLETSVGAKVADRLFAETETLHAPHLIDLEIAQVLRRFVRNGEFGPARGRQALDDLADVRVTRYAHALLLPRVWDLRNNFTAYDAVYIALAEALDAPLLTRDTALSSAAGHRAQIELV
jgi:predicted nucleic acid-binding protein